MSQDKQPTAGGGAADEVTRTGRHFVTIDELVAKSQSVFDRVRRAAARVRTRLVRDREAK
jgi:hypothetical protein